MVVADRYNVIEICPYQVGLKYFFIFIFIFITLKCAYSDAVVLAQVQPTCLLK
jgi:hypothetical protein